MIRKVLVLGSLVMVAASLSAFAGTEKIPGRGTPQMSWDVTERCDDQQVKSAQEIAYEDAKKACRESGGKYKSRVKGSCFPVQGNKPSFNCTQSCEVYCELE